MAPSMPLTNANLYRAFGHSPVKAPVACGTLCVVKPSLGMVRYHEAIETLERALELAGFQEDLAGALAYAYAAAGDRDAAARATEDLERRLAEGRVGPFALALAYAGQGDLDRAFDYLNRAIDVRDSFLPEDFFDPLLDPLRADPRFTAINARMGVQR